MKREYMLVWLKGYREKVEAVPCSDELIQRAVSRMAKSNYVVSRNKNEKKSKSLSKSLSTSLVQESIDLTYVRTSI